MLIVQEREKPCAQIRTWLPQMLLGDCPSQAALDKVVGARQIAGQSARIATQSRDLCLNQPSEIIHRITSFSHSAERACASRENESVLVTL
jgi:hypothetical protein